MAKFEYAPAPESRAVVDIKPSYGLFINGEFTEPQGGSAFKSISPSTEEVLAEVTEASDADVDRAVARRPPRLQRRVGPDVRRRPRQVPLPHRPHPAGARPRVRRPREPRQRQADQGEPRRRRARWPRRTSSTTRAGPTSSTTPALGTDTAPARRRRPGHPVELPAAHAGVEDRARPGHRQHRRPQAGRDHAADRAALRRGLPAGRPAAGRRQHRHRRRSPPVRPSSTTPASTSSRSPARPASAR